MSPTIAEVAVGLIAVVLIFMVAVRLIPLVIGWFAEYFNQSVDDDLVEKDTDQYEG